MFLRHAISTGPLARSQLIWPPGHQVWYFQAPILVKYSKLKDFKILITGTIHDFLFWTTWIWSWPAKVVSDWPRWATNFQNLTTFLLFTRELSLAARLWTKRDWGYLSTYSNHTLMYLFTCYSAQLERHSLFFYIVYFVHWEFFHQKNQIERTNLSASDTESTKRPGNWEMFN